MKGIPLIETNDPALIVRGYNLGLKLVSNVPQVLTPEQLEYYEKNLAQLQEALRRGFLLPGEMSRVEVLETKPQTSLILTGTGQTLGDWLKAREEMHKFLTGEKVILQDMFVIDEATLVRTDIMPVFRPVGATNRMALDWKVKLGMNASYEEDQGKGGVMMYRNSGGPKEPQLGFVRRSVRPDDDTLGKHAKSPDGLLETKKIWINLFGYSDADNLHFLITGEHLDSVDTLTWFPDDRLPGGREVAHGSWYVGSARAGFHWYDRGRCSPRIGARLAEFFSLRKS